MTQALYAHMNNKRKKKSCVFEVSLADPQVMELHLGNSI
jgi:hypothetical protein